MKERLVRKLAVQESVRRVTASESCWPRYLGFLGCVGGSLWLIPIAPRNGWILCAGALALALALFRPWHRQVQVEMDSPLLRLHVLALGLLPVVRRDFELEGRQLVVDRRMELLSDRRGRSALGLLLHVVPFAGLLHLALSPRDPQQVLIHWVLCLEGEDEATEELLSLKRREAALPFLAAARRVVPEHVEAA